MTTLAVLAFNYFYIPSLLIWNTHITFIWDSGVDFKLFNCLNFFNINVIFNLIVMNSFIYSLFGNKILLMKMMKFFLLVIDAFS